MSEWIDVCAADELESGDSRTVWLDDTEVAVINLNGKYYAIEDICNHDGGELTGGCIEGNEIECPRHGARFDITTGEFLAPPAYDNVETYRTRIHDVSIHVAAEPDRYPAAGALFPATKSAIITLLL